MDWEERVSRLADLARKRDPDAEQNRRDEIKRAKEVNKKFAPRIELVCMRAVKVLHCAYEEDRSCFKSKDIISGYCFRMKEYPYSGWQVSVNIRPEHGSIFVSSELYCGRIPIDKFTEELLAEALYAAIKNSTKN